MSPMRSLVKSLATRLILAVALLSGVAEAALAYQMMAAERCLAEPGLQIGAPRSPDVHE